MTFIATLKLNQKKAMVLSDYRATSKDGVPEHSNKTNQIGMCVVAECGDSSPTYMFRDGMMVWNSKAEAKNATFEQYLDAAQEVFAEVYTRIIEGEVLTQYEMDWNDYRMGGFGAHIDQRIKDEIKEKTDELEMTIMLCGYHPVLGARIYTLDPPAKLEIHENYHVMGQQTESAEQRIVKLINSKKGSIPEREAVFELLWIAKDVSNNVFVSEEFSLWAVRKRGIQEIDGSTIKEVYKLMEGEEGEKPKTKTEILKTISELMKEEEED